ncbi:hypothetical protein GCM10008983_11410 [Lentibacillus halophilus]|uniref:Tumour necrosis factor receptor superfamily member 19 n=1 Tax=Lentibacillus halophilus TaxID=295065 RepID=A0ABN0Z760_9BACI
MVISMGFSVLVFVVIVVVIYRMVSGKGTPDNSYTPFDHITGQADTDFHEETTDVEQDDD